MEQFRGRRPSPALAVATAALILAGTGTAAASGPFAVIAKELGLNGKQKQQVAAIAGKQIAAKAPTLTVLNATNATNAANAANATNATNAGNAATVGGLGPSAFVPASRVITYAQTTNAMGTGGASGTGVLTLATVGPFTIVGKCVSYAGGSSARTYIRTTQGNSAVNLTLADNTDDLTPTTDAGSWQQGGTDVPGDDPIGNQAVGTPGTPSFQESPQGPTSAISGDGQTRLLIQPIVGSYLGAGTAPACTFYGSIIAS